MRQVAVAAGAVVLAASAALGQTVDAEKAIGAGVEPAIAASRSTGDVIIAWQNNENLFYAVSLNGGGSFGGPQSLVPPGCSGLSLGFDPMVGASYWTGDLWIGAIALPANGPLFVVRKYPGASLIDMSTVVPITSCPHQGPYAFDKGFLAVGPRTFQQTGNAEAMYAAWRHAAGSAPNDDTIYSSRSSDAGAPGALWPAQLQRITGPGTSAPLRAGKGTFPLVIQNASAAPNNFRGRVLVAYTPGPFTHLNINQPHVSFSDQGGVEGSWSTPRILNQYGSPAQPINTALGTLSANARATSWSMGFAENHAVPNMVAVAFAGRASGVNSRYLLSCE
jgi:hypothetical protein